VVSSLNDPDLNVRQGWTLTRVDVDAHSETVIGSGQVAPYFVGPVSMPDYASLAKAAVQTLGDGTKVFVGPRDDPFFVDLAAVFDLLSIRKLPGNKGKGVDGVGGYNVMSIVIQVPKTRLTKDGTAPDPARANNVIGVWDTAERLKNQVINGDGTITVSGPEQQVSRLGMPLVNEIVIPLGKKDLFNASEPENDVANFGANVVDPEPAKLLHALFGINVPPAPPQRPRRRVRDRRSGLNQPANVAPGEMLRLNMSIAPAKKPSRFGVLAGDVAGFPTAAGWRTTWWTSSCAWSRACWCPASTWRRTTSWATAWTPTTSRSCPTSRTSPCRRTRATTSTTSTDGRRHWDRDDDLGATRRPRGAVRLELRHPRWRCRRRTRARRRPPVHAAADGQVTLAIFDAQGRVVRTLIHQDAAAGTFRASWDGLDDAGRSLPRGLFFARLTAAGGAAETKKLVLE
jgi:hypothetical protein